MDGRVATRDVYGIAARHTYLCIFQVDVRIAARHPYGMAGRAAEVVGAVVVDDVVAVGEVDES